MESHVKKLSSIILSGVLVLAAFSGCKGAEASGRLSGSAPAEVPGLSVVTTNFPPYDFVREIAGAHITPTLLLPPGAEAHSYEPTPQDIITIQSCDVFIYTGGESDGWIEDILASMDTPNMTILSMTEMVETKEEVLVEGMEGGEEDNDNETEVEYDEHVWTSLKNAATIMENITQTLR